MLNDIIIKSKKQRLICNKLYALNRGDKRKELNSPYKETDFASHLVYALPTYVCSSPVDNAIQNDDSTPEAGKSTDALSDVSEQHNTTTSFSVTHS